MHVLRVSFPQPSLVIPVSLCLVMGYLVPVTYSAQPSPQNFSNSITSQIPSTQFSKCPIVYVMRLNAVFLDARQHLQLFLSSSRPPVIPVMPSNGGYMLSMHLLFHAPTYSTLKSPLHGGHLPS